MVKFYIYCRSTWQPYGSKGFGLELIRESKEQALTLDGKIFN